MLRIIHSSGKVCGQIDPELSLNFTWNLAWKAKVDCQKERGQQGKEESQMLARLFPLHIRAHSCVAHGGLSTTWLCWGSGNSGNLDILGRSLERCKTSN